MKRACFFLLVLTICIPFTMSQGITADQILKKMDEQLLTSSSYVEAEMIIKPSDADSRSLEFKSYSIGVDLALLEFTAPAREKGIKFLKREKTMWLYFPRADRIRQIKGHMLRQGMMGSDYSYEDASETDSVEERYNAKLLGEEKYEGRDVYKLEMKAKRPDVTYQQQIVYVDKEWYIPLKSELYAKSGLLLKEMLMWDVKKIGDRWYPMSTAMINRLGGESRTDLKIKKLQIDVKIPEEIFSLSYLKKR